MSSTEAVDDIITYLNRRELGPTLPANGAAHDRPLYSAGPYIHADYAGLRLGSLFQPIVAAGDDATIVGFEALLAAETVSGFAPLGAALAPQSVFALPHSRDEIIALDRLARTLHALNFLVQDRAADLHLNVDPHHLVAVSGDHGQVFEQILRQCGLDPAAIILEVPEHRIRDKTRLRTAIASWQSRGYRIAIDNFEQTAQWQRVLGLKPDFVKLGRELLQDAIGNNRQRDAIERFIARAQTAGVDVIATGIENNAQHDLACKLGVTRLQGFLLGRPAPDCSQSQLQNESQLRYA